MTSLSKVVRDRNGVLGGDQVPVVTWEDPEARVVLPTILMNNLGIDSPVVRYARSKRISGMTKHSHAAKYITDPNLWINQYVKAGVDRRSSERRIVLIEDGEWMIKIAMGPTKSTLGWSIATVFATNKPREKERWVKLIEEE